MLKNTGQLFRKNTKQSNNGYLTDTEKTGSLKLGKH